MHVRGLCDLNVSLVSIDQKMIPAKSTANVPGTINELEAKIIH